MPCNEKTCIQTGSNLVPADMNLDGTIAPGEGYTEPIYKCKADATHGHTGTYENALSWGKEKKSRKIRTETQRLAREPKNRT